MTPTVELIIDIAQLLLIVSLAGVPALVVSVLARRKAPVRRIHRRVEARRMSAAAVAAADAVAGKVLLPPTELAGISLYCKECGGESPDMPIEKTAVASVGPGFVVVATCRLCWNPLVSRVLDKGKADEFLAAGAVNETDLVDAFRQELADL